MVKFKLRATITEELPEAEIEANTREEAEENYSKRYEIGELEGDFHYIYFDGDNTDAGEVA